MQKIPDMYDRLHILQKYRNVAIVGVSADPYRPSHFVALYLQAERYNIIPINPRYAGQTLFGKHVYASLTEAQAGGETIEIVDVFRKAQETPPLVAEARQVGAQVFWLQLGIVSPEAHKQAQEAGLIFVENKCMKIEHARFLGNGVCQ